MGLLDIFKRKAATAAAPTPPAAPAPEIPAPLAGRISGITKTDFTASFIGRRLENPDKVLQANSKATEHLYDEMLRKDTAIFQAIQTRVNAVTACEWDVTPASAAPRDAAIAEFIKANIAELNIERSFGSLLQSGLMGGLGISEIIYAPRGGRIVAQRLISQKPWQWRWDADGDRLYYLTLAEPLNGEEVPMMKFQHFIFGERYDNKYGNGLGQVLYWPYWFKKNLVTFRLKSAEKFGMPTMKGTYPQGTSPEEQDKLLSVIMQIQAETGFIVPEGMKVEVVEAFKAGRDPFEPFINYWDEQIAKVVLGQTLTSGHGQTGSLAMAQVHERVRGDLLKGDADLLSQYINAQLVRHLVNLNFSGVTAYPKFWFNTSRGKDIKTLAEVFKTLSDTGVKITKEQIQEDFGMDQTLPDEDYIARPVAVPGGADTPVRARAGVPVPPKPQFAKADSGNLHAKRIRDMEKALAAVDAVAAPAANADPYKSFREGITRAVKENRLPAAADFDAEPLTDELHKIICASWINAAASAKRDLAMTASAYPEAASAHFSIHSPTAATFATSEDYVFDMVPPEEALKWWEQKMPVAYDDYKNIIDPKLRAKAFSLAEAQTAEIAGEVKKLIGDTLAAGGSVSDFTDKLQEMFARLGIDAIDRRKAELVYQMAAHSAFNAGRWNIYRKNPMMRGIYGKYEYKTAGDDHVRPAHEVMDGIVRPADDPFWSVWWPPNGFRCRCTVLAISIYEDAPVSDIPRRPDGGAWSPDPGFGTNAADNYLEGQ